MRRLTGGLIHGAAGLALALGAAAAAAAAEQYTLNIGHVHDTQHPVHVGAQRFAQAAAEKSGGRIKINIFPGSQLGDRDAIQNTQSGVIHGVIDTTTKLVTFVPEYGALDLPYLVKTQEEAYRLLDGPVVRRAIDEKGARAGFRVPVHWEITLRNIYTGRKPVRSLADLKGLKIRVIQSPSYITLFRALGASPTPMAFGELYSALQQGVVDGAENDLVTYHNTRHFEVAKNLAITHHIMLVNSPILSERHWKGYPPDIQKALTEAALEGRKALMEYRAAREAKVLETLKTAGVQMTQPDLAPFVDLARKSYSEFEGKLGKDLIQKMTEAAR
jgi:tripartite ATP-independent transporter DctP family solute receptor